jgi:hypothetical protein
MTVGKGTPGKLDIRQRTARSAQDCSLTDTVIVSPPGRSLRSRLGSDRDKVDV